MGKTKIQWSEFVWNCVRGCSMAKGSEASGCLNCYAARQAARGLPGMNSPTTGEPFAVMRDSGPRWTGKVELIESMLDVHLRRRKPTTWFVNSMSDLFHESLPDEAIDRVFAVMALCPQHRFQVLTKRAERMREYLSDGIGLRRRVVETSCDCWDPSPEEERVCAIECECDCHEEFEPFHNIRLGVSIEDQPNADRRFPTICELGEAGWNTMVSLEPLLGPVFIPQRYLALGERAWCVAGGESGPGSRPCDVAWIRSIVDQCAAAGVRCFVKQLGARPIRTSPNKPSSTTEYLSLQDHKGGNPSEWPEWARVRQMPDNSNTQGAK